jgi:PD-(D/E)XK nuclease superfamily
MNLVSEFSPSAMKTAAACWRQWYDEKILGNNVQVPKKGTTLGKMTHARLDGYASGRTIDDPWFTPEDLLEFELAKAAGLDLDALWLHSRPMAIAAFPHIPPPQANMASELPVVLDVDRPWRVSPRSRLDLIAEAQDATGPLLVVTDYKTTAGATIDGVYHPWHYVPSGEQLSRDVQLLTYALGAMQQSGVDRCCARWIYISSGPQPLTLVRDVYLTWMPAWEYYQPWLELGDRMHAVVQLTNQHGRLPINQLPQPSVLVPNENAPCLAYGGCSKHYMLGGDCSPGDTIGAWLTLKRYNRRSKK